MGASQGCRALGGSCENIGPSEGRVAGGCRCAKQAAQDLSGDSGDPSGWDHRGDWGFLLGGLGRGSGTWLFTAPWLEGPAGQGGCGDGPSFAMEAPKSDWLVGGTQRLCQWDLLVPGGGHEGEGAAGEATLQRARRGCLGPYQESVLSQIPSGSAVASNYCQKEVDPLVLVLR